MCHWFICDELQIIVNYVWKAIFKVTRNRTFPRHFVQIQEKPVNRPQRKWGLIQMSTLSRNVLILKGLNSKAYTHKPNEPVAQPDLVKVHKDLLCPHTFRDGKWIRHWFCIWIPWFSMMSKAVSFGIRPVLRNFSASKCDISLMSYMCVFAACSSSPCLHDGTCILHTSYTYHCACLAGYTGKRCENGESLQLDSV